MTPPAYTTVFNSTQNCLLADRCELARTFLTRLRGLLGRTSLEPGQGLIIYPESSIHMFFMRFPIDVVFLDRSDQVVGLRENLQPNRSLASVRGARYVIELPAECIAQTGTRLGDQFRVTPSPHSRNNR